MSDVGVQKAIDKLTAEVKRIADLLEDRPVVVDGKILFPADKEKHMCDGCEYGARGSCGCQKCVQ